MKNVILFVFIHFCISYISTAQTSVARDWNNLILESIRNDYARPTVHARNLYHHSIIAYDAWAAFDPTKKTYLLGDTLNGFVCNFDGIAIPLDIKSARETAICYASYRFIRNRYFNSPDYFATFGLINNYMLSNGYDTSFTSTDYVNDGPAALGNYLAEQIQLYGYTDGSNEQNNFVNTYYIQVNPPLVMDLPGNPDIQDPNHWQPISLINAIDQSGNPIVSTPPFLSPEWGDVSPFALDTTMYTELVKDGDTYKVYFDTLKPAFLNLTDSAEWDSFYKWNHSLVSIWQSHLDPNDGVMWDISPASNGNNTWYPTDSTTYSSFYDLLNGGDPSTGYALNPITGLPYTPQIVPRGDYARVLAEFWADGLDSETPPGHWFEIYHYVTDQPLFTRQWQGVGPVLDTLEYDVKAQLAMGGTMHDAAICAWSLKGYYDYIRPVSAIRYMGDQGQSTDTLAANYNPNGIPLLPGFIETVQIGDPLAGTWNENVGKIKLFTWKGHDYINDPLVDIAGVDWILAEDWWPYQRPTFVTPPFAGFVSGHSTFSRAASKIMEFITGSAFFPGGMGEFYAEQNEFLQFEEGPSVPITLQWATYKDAADQCSLSRIWGGIHPPIDDIPGRRIGEIVGTKGFDLADSIYSIENPGLIASAVSDTLINSIDIGSQFTIDFTFNTAMDTLIIPSINLFPAAINSTVSLIQINWVDSFNVHLTLDVLPSSAEFLTTKINLDNLMTGNGQMLTSYTFSDYFIVDTKLPLISNLTVNTPVVNDQATNQELLLTIVFDEACDTLIQPVISFSGLQYINPTFTAGTSASIWLNDTTFNAYYTITDFNEEVDLLDIEISNVADIHFNSFSPATTSGVLIIDTKNPIYTIINSSQQIISQADLISPSFDVTVEFDQAMDTTFVPNFNFLTLGNVYSTLLQNGFQSYWVDTNILFVQFNIFPANNDLTQLDFQGNGVLDEHQNLMLDSIHVNLLISDMLSPTVLGGTKSHNVISDSVIGNNIYYVDIEFSESMDTLIKPLVTHNAMQTISGSVQYNFPISHFIDSFTYRAYFQVFDQNIEINPVHLMVDFGKDFVGNSQIAFIDSSFTALDTKNPSVTGIYANNNVISQNGQALEIISLFDEPMSPLLDANLSFNPIILSPTVINTIDSSWINSTMFSFNYVVNGPSNQVNQYDVLISGVTDEAGNLLIPYIAQNFITIEQLLQLTETSFNEIVLYPSIINNGSKLYIKGYPISSQDFNLNIFDMMGQRIGFLHFNQVGNLLVSPETNLSPGMYILQNDEFKFKIIAQ